MIFLHLFTQNKRAKMALYRSPDIVLGSFKFKGQNDPIAGGHVLAHLAHRANVSF